MIRIDLLQRQEQDKKNGRIIQTEDKNKARRRHKEHKKKTHIIQKERKEEDKRRRGHAALS